MSHRAPAAWWLGCCCSEPDPARPGYEAETDHRTYATRCSLEESTGELKYKQEGKFGEVSEATREVSTRQPVITTALHVEGGQVQSQVLDELEQPVPDSVDHHSILGVQFSRTADQTAQQRVDSAWNKTRNRKDTSRQDSSLSLRSSPSKMILQGVKKALNRGTLGKRRCSL